ncbi:MAG TPA: PGPGW domain-containing protein [Candidatus Limnocylindrales bacterium]|jgi:uncharacterized membrane protein YbaN (DUF454 family)|nr:PGPGW domain-containing protein [Candidatus Limnocylindrales bacterium]
MRILREVTGWTSLALALILFPLPLLPTLLLLGGLVILASHYSWAKRWLSRVKKLIPSAQPAQTIVAEEPATP